MRVLSFGEVLLRLSSPGYTRLFQKDSFDVSFCGSEANVAVSLAILGVNSSFLSILPDNDIGRAAVCSMRYFGVDLSLIQYGKGRLGTYYLEKGVSQRPSKIIYDREYSAFALATRYSFHWDKIFEGISWFHWTGINPALSDNLADICLDACIEAKKRNITISCDLNYRKNLWSNEKAQNVMRKLMPYVDVCFANEEDAEMVLGIKADDNDIERGKINKSGYKKVAEKICEQYNCKYVAITLRASHSASRNGWSAMLYQYTSHTSYFSKEYDIQIVDRVGGGDSFTAGMIFSLLTGKTCQEAVDFSAAASCLKHTIEGDFNRTTEADVKNLLKTCGNGRVQR